MTQTVARLFESNLDHLSAEISLLDLRLSRAVQNMSRSDSGGLEENFRGLLVSAEQLTRTLPAGTPHLGELEAEPDPFLSAISMRQEELAEARSESLKRGVSLRLEKLRDFYELDDWETGVIILCLAPEMDRKYDSVYAYLQDDVTKKWPTVDLALQLFCPDLEDRLLKRESFVFPAPLMRHELVHVGENSNVMESPLLAHFLRLETRVANYLLGSDGLDERLRSTELVARPGVLWDQVVLPHETRALLEHLPQNLRADSHGGAGVVLHLVGPSGIGKKTVAKALCHGLGKGLLVVDCAILLASEQGVGSFAIAAYRDAFFHDAVLCWDNFHLLLGGDSKQQAARSALIQGLSPCSTLTILAGEEKWRAPAALEQQTLLTVEIPRPDFSQREQLWTSHLSGHQTNLTAEEVTALAGRFRFNGGQIRRAVATARDLARWRSESERRITLDDLNSAARWHSSQGLARVARKIETHYSWDDIVLPEDQKTQLKEICGYFENIPLVFGEWGFQSKTNLGKGLTILFAGPSGTGKTMASEIMSGALGLDLYKIDLASLVSKYIGETEKNLDAVFSEAEDSNSILFFDEADAIFGKRSEVRDAHDRYANVEVSYLLQKMEEYQGIVILATNFRRNMDDAFVRRLQFAVEFPFPEEEYRLQIWERVFPPEAPLEDDVDLRFLARQLKLSGGNIKNIAVAGAFLAAQESASIGMKQVMWATKREYQKMGKLLVDSDFGQYFDLVKGESHAQV